jgi:hypothetical protein
MNAEDLKSMLLDSFWGTDRGLAASSDSRAEINELLTQLESKNPTPMPNEAQEKLSGTWKLIYTSNSELVALLALDRLPLITVGDIFQTVNGTAMTVENKIQLSWPLARTSLAATADFEVRSPKLLQVQFKEGQIATPKITSDLTLPSSIDFMGQTVDVSPLTTALAPLEQPLQSLISSVGSLLDGLPDLKFPIPASSSSFTSLSSSSSSSSSKYASTWLLNTYLDDDFRISRGDGGSVFVMVKVPPSDMDYNTSSASITGILTMESEEGNEMEEERMVPTSDDEWELNVSQPTGPSAAQMAAELTGEEIKNGGNRNSSDTYWVGEADAEISNSDDE